MSRLLALPFLALLAAAQLAAKPRVEFELVYLANEGFLLRAGERELVIDAFVNEAYGEYACVPAELREAMLAKRAPFADVELALTSHVHRDHFQADAAAAFLRAHAETSFAAAPQVVDGLKATLGDDPASARLTALLPGERETLSRQHGAIAVELLRLPHSGGARTASVQNLGHVIELGGARILHVGDADGDDAALAAYDLPKRALDVALVPYWWLGDAAGVARAKAVTGAKHLVAVHVPPGEVAEVKSRLAALDPALLLFERAGESRTLSLAR